MKAQQMVSEKKVLLKKEISTIIQEGNINNFAKKEYFMFCIEKNKEKENHCLIVLIGK